MSGEWVAILVVSALLLLPLLIEYGRARRDGDLTPWPWEE